MPASTLDAPTAVTYSRLASRAPHDHAAAEHQQHRCRQHAHQLQMTIVQEFTDIGQPGSTTARPGMRALFQYIATHPVQQLIVSDLTRLGRNYDDIAKLRTELRKQNCTILVAAGSGEPPDCSERNIGSNEFSADAVHSRSVRRLKRIFAHRTRVATRNLPVARDRLNQPLVAKAPSRITIGILDHVNRIVDGVADRLVQQLHLLIRQMRDMKILKRIAHLHRDHQNVPLPWSQSQEIVLGHSRSIVSRSTQAAKHNHVARSRRPLKQRASGGQS